MNLLLVAGLAAIWMLFAPVKLGGQVTYIMVDGTSMLPNYHTGDLVLIRQASTYQVGDVVTYLDGFTGAHIIHRIIGTQQDRFVIKGDNNAWIDATQPTSAKILGKLWIHLSKVGLAVDWVRAPLNLALATGLLGGFFMVTITAQKPTKNGKKKNGSARTSTSSFELFLYIFGGVGLAFLVLAIFVFSRPEMIKADNIPYQQTGIFAYSAAGTSTVYDSGFAVSGEPVFTKLTCKLNLGFAYTLQGKNLENITGTRKIYALVQDVQSGWQRTIPVATDINFTGNTSSSQASLNLCQIAAMVASVGKETGIDLKNYTIVVVAHISVSGKMSGQKFSDTFDPRLNFGFDGLHLYLIESTSQTSPLQTVQAGTLLNSSLVANTFPLLSLKPTVAKMRMFSLMGLGSSLAGLLAIGLYSFFQSRHYEESAIQMKYAALLMGVREAGLESLSPVIDVIGIEDLVKLAERQNVMIMHLGHAEQHYYLVQVEGKTFRYVTGQGHGAASGRE